MHFAVNTLLVASATTFIPWVPDSKEVFFFFPRESGTQGIPLTLLLPGGGVQSSRCNDYLMQCGQWSVRMIQS